MTALPLSPARLQQVQHLLAATPFKGATLHALPGDASFRRYIRVEKGKKTAILMDAPPEKENVRPYVAIAEYLLSHGYSAPAILARDVNSGLLLLEDLGDDSFTSVLKKTPKTRKKSKGEELYGAAIDVLAEWHGHKRRTLKPHAVPLPAYNETLLMQEVSLFTDWYLPQAIGKDKAAGLKAEYLAIWQDILRKGKLATDVLVHRDYHADNLMWLPKRDGVQRVGLLDFQDGVCGDAAYDLVSLLEDARHDVPQPLVEAMVARYLDATGCDQERFRTSYAILGAQRNSKIIGIFSRLAARDNKASYLHFLPRVWRHLETDVTQPALIPLRQWLNRHIPAEQRGVITVSHKQLLRA